MLADTFVGTNALTVFFEKTFTTNACVYMQKNLKYGFSEEYLIPNINIKRVESKIGASEQQCMDNKRQNMLTSAALAMPSWQ